MSTFEELGNKYEQKIKSLSNFKIGKTGQTIKERYEEEYSDTYEKYKVIGNSKSAATVDKFEKYMIVRFMDLNNCDNEQIRGGEMTESEKYIVYLVYNE